MFYMVFGFEDMNDMDLRIIRAELLVEKSLLSLARSRVENPTHLKRLGFGMARTLTLAMLTEDEDPLPLEAAKHIHDARNCVAHELDVDPEEVNRKLGLFFRAAGVEPEDGYSNLQIATAAVCGQLNMLQQNGNFRRNVERRLFADWKVSRSSTE